MNHCFDLFCLFCFVLIPTIRFGLVVESEPRRENKEGGGEEREKGSAKVLATYRKNIIYRATKSSNDNSSE